ncbi:ATP-binding protein [Vibrio ezurae]|uniref:histidine kinase n=2 Tax=Vibrio ezurae TaxID=252583 RepID=U3AH60_9VIBR|nr:ATP-binding protein [Vibrio ezurae]GAD79251.1 putative two-component histidine kinase [Vibrio ezurae NBRC 102218]
MFAKFHFQSMVSRITFSMLTVILLAEFFVGTIWYTSTSNSKKESAWSAMSAITLSAADTINYFVDLPLNYRHLVLEQLRNIGGTRFFISVNNHYIDIKPLENYPIVQDIEFNSTALLYDKLNYQSDTSVVITKREDLVVFDSKIKIDDLPALWRDYTLVLGELDLPIVVIQKKLDDGHWLYMATVLPLSFSSITNVIIESKQLLFFLIVTILLSFVSYIVTQKEVRPFRSLAKSASLMSAQLEVDQIKEEGSAETRAAIHAFNKMNYRIKSYLRDRELFFNAVSHDIKTPLACLKLRTEMLPDEKTRVRFEKLLKDMELMLNGALQCLKDEGIHEELEWVDIIDVITLCSEIHNQNGRKVYIEYNSDVEIFGKPLAIKRCISNVIENGVKYGNKVDISVVMKGKLTSIAIRDYGEGIPTDKFEEVFKPYSRLEPLSVDVSGLGLSIARNIARNHGGDIMLSNAKDEGLVVQITLESVK